MRSDSTFGFACLALIGCSGHASVVAAPAPVVATATVVEPAPVREASPPPVVTATPAPAAQNPAPPKVVLHLGDSMVDPYNGLAKALGPKFEALGARYYDDSEQSVGIAVYDREKRIDLLIARRAPDLVLITLGANDVSVPFPAALAKHVQSIVRRAAASGRACYWLLPPPWKKDTGVLDVIRANAAPCKVFDASNLKIARRADGIHPNAAGGAKWAEAFFAYYEGTGPAVPNEAAEPTVTAGP